MTASVCLLLFALSCHFSSRTNSKHASIEKEVLLLTDRKVHLHGLNLQTLSCSSLESLKALGKKNLLVDCAEISDMEIDRFFEQGGSAIFFRTEYSSNLNFADKFGVRLHKTTHAETWNELSKHNVIADNLKIKSVKSQFFLSYDIKNTVLFPLIASTKQFQLENAQFSPKSFLVGAQMRNMESKAIFSSWSLDEISKDMLLAALNWLQAPAALQYQGIRVYHLNGQLFKVGEEHLNFVEPVKRMEFVFKITDDFPFALDWNTVIAEVKVDCVDSVLLHQQIIPSVSDDGKELVFSVEKGFYPSVLVSRILFNLRNEGLFNVQIEELLRCRPHLDKDVTDFEWKYLDNYVLVTSIFTAIILFLNSWFGEIKSRN